MDTAMVADVRRFQRAVTDHVGALDESFLARGRPLGQSRILWEIGPDGCEIRALRARLSLDSGYLSRVLHTLASAGLVTLDPGSTDARVRAVRLTAAGLAECAVLDELSDRRAEEILDPLTPPQRERLVDAMGEVERLLTASAISLKVCDPRSPAARACIQSYFDELVERFEGGFDPGRSISASAEELTPPAGLLVVGALRAEPVACGAVRFVDDTAQIKRMWVARAVRGLGLGRRLLAELEARAVAAGARVARLETNRTLAEAIRLYRSAGYRETPRFNDETYADHWFEKVLRGGGGVEG